MQNSAWWRQSVIYQVYIRSYADGNGDGTGDIAGLRSKLEYLEQLGVDALWINPWYASPLNDGGYDVSDYRQIDTRFGDVAEAEAFIAEAHAKGIKVIADLVPNHTSSEHEWFVEAMAAEPGDPARDRYLFRAGKGVDGSEPPSNWEAVFGGSAWEQVADGEWYLHLFDVSQPDLNWEHPEVRAEFESIFRFWLDRGIDGFRIDVAHGMVKDMTFPDVKKRTAILEVDTAGGIDLDDGGTLPYWDRDGVHEINRSWRAILDEYDDRMMVAEAWVHPDRLPLYLRPDEYQQSFNFELLETPWDAAAFRDVIERSVAAATAVGATSSWVLSNHDVMRHATRYGLPNGTPWRQWPAAGPHDILEVELGARRARVAAMITLSLPGATYVYQGEELGLPEVWDLPEDVLDDPTWERSGHTERGRDGCRVPIPWTIEGPSFGFGTTDPWLPQPAFFGELSAEAQDGEPTSMLNLYRSAIALRREHLLSTEEIELVDLGDDGENSDNVLAYTRADLLIVANMGSDPVPMPAGEILLASGEVGDTLPGDTAVWMTRS